MLKRKKGTVSNFTFSATERLRKWVETVLAEKVKLLTVPFFPFLR